ncbi:MAG: (2Fe-2S) ferredoxin domain-containing protein, partial [Bacteroidales bacterium]|nr:(2Fe-2S) ferredoxin domain-containing protein [Bacteroidales bacterium]
MAKIKNLAELRKMREDQQKQLNLREKSNDPEKYVQIKVGMATSGIA